MHALSINQIADILPFNGKVNESWLHTRGSTKKIFLIDYVKIYLISIFFYNRFCPAEKCGVIPHCLHRDSLTLSISLLFHPD